MVICLSVFHRHKTVVEININQDCPQIFLSPLWPNKNNSLTRLAFPAPPMPFPSLPPDRSLDFCKNRSRLGMVAHAYNPRYSGGGEQ
jgi:hypothetical protein